MNSDPHLIPPPKKNSKWTLHLNIERSIIKLLEANTGENCCDSGLGKYFLKYDTKSVIQEREDQSIVLYQN